MTKLHCRQHSGVSFLVIKKFENLRETITTEGLILTCPTGQWFSAWILLQPFLSASGNWSSGFPQPCWQKVALHLFCASSVIASLNLQVLWSLKRILLAGTRIKKCRFCVPFADSLEMMGASYRPEWDRNQTQWKDNGVQWSAELPLLLSCWQHWKWYWLNGKYKTTKSAHNSKVLKALKILGGGWGGCHLH